MNNSSSAALTTHTFSTVLIRPEAPVSADVKVELTLSSFDPGLIASPLPWWQAIAFQLERRMQERVGEAPAALSYIPN